MRLSKRQLKRIIREEYTRLKRRGLITETNFMAMGAPYNTRAFSDWCDCVDSLYDEDEGWTTNTLGYLWEEDIEEITMEEDEEGMPDDSNLHVVSRFDEMGHDAYGVCAYLVDLSMRNGKDAGNIEFLMNKFMKFAQDEQGYHPPRDF